MGDTETTPTPNPFVQTRRYVPRSKSSPFWGPACVVALINLYAIAAMYGNDEFSRESVGKLIALELDAPITSKQNDRWKICPAALPYFDETEQSDSLVFFLQQNVDFHVFGGNLKSVQRLKDDSIDSTFERMEMKFMFHNQNALQKRPRFRPQQPRGKHYEKNITQTMKQHFSENPDPRGGYGQPLPGIFAPTPPTLVAGRYVDVLESIEGSDRWDASLGPIGPNCSNLVEIGEKGHFSSKWMCRPEHEKKIQDQQQQPSLSLRGGLSVAGNKNTNCHVISMGGNDDWNFELNFVNTFEGCVTHTFDCTLRDGTPRRKPDRDDIRFYNACVDNKSWTDSFGRKYMTYMELLEMAGLAGPPDLFKIDVEGFEYDILTQMIRDPATQPYLPQQISIELHWATRMVNVDWLLRLRTSGELALFSNMMFTGGGYMPVYTSFNAHCAACMEVLYFKSTCFQ